MKQSFICHACNGKTTLNVDKKKLDKYSNGEGSIQELFSDKDSFYREVLISGTCYSCQEKIFHRPAPGHEEQWGAEIGECECCGSPVYECDLNDGKFKCSSCGCDMYVEV